MEPEAVTKQNHNFHTSQFLYKGREVMQLGNCCLPFHPPLCWGSQRGSLKTAKSLSLLKIMEVLLPDFKTHGSVLFSFSRFAKDVFLQIDISTESHRTASLGFLQSILSSVGTGFPQTGAAFLGDEKLPRGAALPYCWRHLCASGDAERPLGAHMRGETFKDGNISVAGEPLVFWHFAGKLKSTVEILSKKCVHAHTCVYIYIYRCVCIHLCKSLYIFTCIYVHICI